MPEQRDEWTLDVAHLTSRLRRRWRVVAVTALVGLGVGASAAVLVPREYSATASVAVSPIRMPGATNVQQINIDTESAVMRSREVAALAAKGLGSAVDADTLVDGSGVAAPQGSEVLQVTVTAATPREAADRADAMESAYLQFRGQSAQQIAQPSIDALDARLAALPAGQSGTSADLRAQKVALQHVGDAVGRIIGRAVVPSSPSSLGLPVFLVAGTAAGLLTGLVLALLRDRLDPRVRDAARFAEVTGRVGIAMSRGQEQDAMRWLVRGLLAAPKRRQQDLVVVAVIGDQPRLIADLLMQLPDFMSAVVHRRLRVVPAEQLLGDVLERDFVVSTVSGDEIVMIDGGRIGSSAQRAVLLEAGDAVVVVAGRRSRLQALTALLAPLDGVDGGSVIPVLMESATAHPALTPRPLAAPRGVPAR